MPRRSQRRPALTLSQLEARVIEEADALAADLSFILGADVSDEVIQHKLPDLRRRVFTRLTESHRIFND